MNMDFVQFCAFSPRYKSNDRLGCRLPGQVESCGLLGFVAAGNKLDDQAEAKARAEKAAAEQTASWFSLLV